MKYLKQLTTADVRAVQRFNAEASFGNVNNGVKLQRMDQDFAARFFCKVDVNLPPVTLRVHSLEKPATHKDIVDELGRDAETPISRLWQLLSLQPHGEPGALLLNVPEYPGRNDNFFYIRGRDGELRAVTVSWRSSQKWGGYHYCRWHLSSEPVLKQTPLKLFENGEEISYVVVSR